MKRSLKRGFGFGTTSGIITTLGLMIGLYSATDSKLVVLGGILTIAIADALSDSLGVHVSEEYAGMKHKQVWHSTFSTFIFKFLTAIIFVIALFIFPLETAIIFNLVLGILILAVSSNLIAKSRKENFSGIFFSHAFMMVVVIIATYYIGKLVLLIS